MFNQDPLGTDMNMAAKPQSGLDDKTEMYELTDKQRVVVNALAQYPDKGPKQIAEIASENLENDTVSRSYVHPIQSKYPHLVKKQREILDNKRTEGTETTTGDPFEGLNETLGSNEGWQNIQDRPVKDTQSGNEQESQRTIQAELTRGDVERLLSGDVPEEFRRLLVIRIVEQAFE